MSATIRSTILPLSVEDSFFAEAFSLREGCSFIDYLVDLASLSAAVHRQYTRSHPYLFGG